MSARLQSCKDRIGVGAVGGMRLDGAIKTETSVPGVFRTYAEAVGESW
jgi:hypothetical protein